MKLFGFNYTKLNIEKSASQIPEDLKLGTNVDITSIDEAKSDILKAKEQILGVKFKYNLDYNPDFAKIQFEGNLLVGVEPREAREILRQWKDKKMPDDFRLKLINLIVRKASLRALQFEEEFSLPIHIPLPKIGIPNKEDSKNKE